MKKSGSLNFKVNKQSLLLTTMCGVLLFTFLVSGEAFADEQWIRFRGPNGSGISEEKGFPGSWKPGEEDWVQTIPGIGHSAVIILDGKLFLTSAIDEGKTRYLFCLDENDGSTIWKKTLTFKASHKNQKNSWASSTPTTDGKKVYVTFSDDDNYTAAAYDLDGNEIWKKSLGPFSSQHGHGVSPVLFEEIVIIANDQKGFGSLIALNKNSGNVVWTTSREFRRVSYSTPILFRKKNQPDQIIVSCGAMGITSVNPADGSLNWYSGELPARTVSSPFIGNGLIYQTCGGGGRGKLMIGVPPDGSGLLDSSFIKYERKRETPYVPTPIAYQGHLYLWCDNGVVSCVEMESGKNLWTKRVGDNYSGSPICVNGIIYILNEQGDIRSIDASPDYHLYPKTELGDPSHSTPSVANGRLYFRTYHKLFCFAAKK